MSGDGFIERSISLFLAGTTKLTTTARGNAVSSLDVDHRLSMSSSSKATLRLFVPDALIAALVRSSRLGADKIQRKLFEGCSVAGDFPGSFSR
jgi:hypothetical protein